MFATFPCGVLCWVWYLIVSIPDLCLLTDFVATRLSNFKVEYTLTQNENFTQYLKNIYFDDRLVFSVIESSMSY